MNELRESKEIANRFREVFLDGTWIANTNYKKQLHTITYKQAIQKKYSLNTIAELTYHINYYLKGILPVFKGEKLEIKDKFSFCSMETLTEEEWGVLKNELIVNAEIFAKYIEEMSETKLEETFENKKYGTYRRNIEGVIEHAYYHLGQISLIKKMISH